MDTAVQILALAAVIALLLSLFVNRCPRCGRPQAMRRTGARTNHPSTATVRGGAESGGNASIADTGSGGLTAPVTDSAIRSKGWQCGLSFACSSARVPLMYGHVPLMSGPPLIDE